MIYAIHELNLFVGHLMEFILVALGLERKPEHAAKGYDGRIELVTTRIRVDSHVSVQTNKGLHAFEQIIVNTPAKMVTGAFRWYVMFFIVFLCV